MDRTLAIIMEMGDIGPAAAWMAASEMARMNSAPLYWQARGEMGELSEGSWVVGS
jgi:hypothetical protein